MLKINKNTVEKILRSGFTLMLGVSLITQITGCSQEQEDTKSFEEIFYDENNEGLDDYFENNVKNSENYISIIIEFEKKINFLKEFNSFLTNPNLNSEFIKKLEKISLSEDMKIDDINNTIEAFNKVRDFFTSDACKGISSEKDQMYTILNDLYKQFLLINKDVKTRKITTNVNTNEFEINYFGLKLINTIPAELKGLNPDNFTITPLRPNEHVINYKGTTTDTIHVTSNVVKEAIDDIYRYQEKESLILNSEEYDEKLINEYLNTLEKYKIILLAKHKTAITNNFFIEQEELQLDDNQNIDEIKKSLRR